METKAGAKLKPSYEDFEPFCKWNTKEGRNILELHLQGCEREKLGVQVTNHGDLTITGERSLDDTRRSRFRQKNRIPKDCDANEIRANFVRGILCVTLPKKVPLSSARENGKPNQEVSRSNAEQSSKVKEPRAVEKIQKANNDKSWNGESKMIAVKVVIAALILIIVVIGIKYRYRKAGRVQSEIDIVLA